MIARSLNPVPLALALGVGLLLCMVPVGTTPRGHSPRPARAPAIWCGVALLMLGAAYYAAGRLVTIDLTVATTALGSLPSFLHVCAFSLLTGALGATTARGYMAICSAWVAINVAFEIGQHAGVSPAIAAQLTHGCVPLKLCERTARYFIHGSFDPMDLLVSVLGGVAAFLILVKLTSIRRLAR